MGPPALDDHLVLDILVPLILLVLVAVAAHRVAILRVLGHVRHVRVDAFGVQRRQGPRQRGRLEVRYGRVPGGQVFRPFRLAAPRRQFLDGLRIEATAAQGIVIAPLTRVYRFFPLT